MPFLQEPILYSPAKDIFMLIRTKLIIEHHSKTKLIIEHHSIIK